MNHEEWLDRAGIYALGALDGEELSRFEAHLAAGCPTCEQHLRQTRESLTLLPGSLPPLAPPPGVKARVMAELAGEASPRVVARPRRRWVSWGAGAGALVAAGLLVALSWHLSATRAELRSLEGRVAALQAALAQRQEILRTALAQREEALRLLGDPQVRFVRLAGLPASPNASGRVLWNPVTRTGILLTTGLPEAPPDRVYELWALAGAEPVPAGLFSVSPEGRAFLRLPPLPEGKAFDKFAVTLEPAGGVPKPTGPMHLLGGV